MFTFKTKVTPAIEPSLGACQPEFVRHKETGDEKVAISAVAGNAVLLLDKDGYFTWSTKGSVLAKYVAVDHAGFEATFDVEPRP